ncbi:hypothetical protein [Algoriphagus aquimarinus]|uniref:Lipoprotein n=1 Tax=Algoriphagus aquimarinus TaxID=237018 RepID=A0A5C7ACU8_9BACT|nr:hypothetical protein [Algoriphagus aquimarinus]TXE04779.1 hypothetical protein ESV85_18750 [Algoriphagus aquimarinus]
MTIQLKIALKFHCMFFLAFFLLSCDYYDGRLEVINNRNYTIAVETFLDSIPIHSEIKPEPYYISNQILPNESIRLIELGSTRGWSSRINRSYNHKLNLFVFKIDSLRIYGIDSLLTMGLYDKYILSEIELDKRNWKVVVN